MHNAEKQHDATRPHIQIWFITLQKEQNVQKATLFS